MPGVFTIRPIEANITRGNDLRKAYCSLMFENKTFTSDVDSRGGKHPEWKDTITLKSTQQYPNLSLDLMDKGGRVEKDCVIGHCDLSLKDVESKGMIKNWFNLSCEGKPVGKILLEAVFKEDYNDLKGKKSTGNAMKTELEESKEGLVGGTGVLPGGVSSQEAQPMMSDKQGGKSGDKMIIEKDQDFSGQPRSTFSGKETGLKTSDERMERRAEYGQEGFQEWTGERLGDDDLNMAIEGGKQTDFGQKEFRNDDKMIGQEVNKGGFPSTGKGREGFGNEASTGMKSGSGGSGGSGGRSSKSNVGTLDQPADKRFGEQAGKSISSDELTRKPQGKIEKDMGLKDWSSGGKMTGEQGERAKPLATEPRPAKGSEDYPRGTQADSDRMDWEAGSKTFDKETSGMSRGKGGEMKGERGDKSIPLDMGQGKDDFNKDSSTRMTGDSGLQGGKRVRRLSGPGCEEMGEATKGLGGDVTSKDTLIGTKPDQDIMDWEPIEEDVDKQREGVIGEQGNKSIPLGMGQGRDDFNKDSSRGMKGESGFKKGELGEEMGRKADKMIGKQGGQNKVEGSKKTI